MVWLIGDKGMLGSEISKLLTEHKIQWIGSDREIDITNPAELRKFATSHGPAANTTGLTVRKRKVPEKITWVINCAAYTAVDKAESEPEIAESLNAEGPLNIARIAREIGAKLIHISTDYVFDGNGKVPYTEEDPKNPVGVYAKTKAEGERQIEKEMTLYYIIRTAWLYGFGGKNFVYTMTKAMNSNDSVKVVNDQKGTPTCAVDLAECIIRIIESSDKAPFLFGKKSALPYGVYHFTNQGETTWYEFCCKIYEYGRKYGVITKDCAVEPCLTEDYPTAAKRPQYSVLSKEKIKAGLKIKIPSWEESLEKFIKSPRFEPK
ncbi:dTDP-4-dehydrorhamnose reductase [Treponema sp.]|uniref:dTDP-4-dehydrorhamnose reductase n=1 Tax=Treponema sp. TaxID=166 RepID=UPI00298DCA8A|nr:dTDP-4-dehydrorhamnose reductase [Treponema sp.]MCQ2241475.1 dTDP-4-dehydrorhamnose reductase [Treponema sp.]